MKYIAIGLAVLLLWFFISYGVGYLIFELGFLPTKENHIGNMVLLGTMGSLIIFGVIAICYNIGKLFYIEVDDSFFTKNKSVSTPLEYKEFKRRTKNV